MRPRPMTGPGGLPGRALPPTQHGRPVVPGRPGQLRRLFDRYLDQVNGARPPAAPPAMGHGVISPHIDYHRGGPVYAAVWQQAAAMAQAADLVSCWAPITTAWATG